MSSLAERLVSFLPEVVPPRVQKLSFSVKAKWTLAVLITYYFLSLTPLYGLAGNALERFTFFSTVLGAEFGSLITLGIGPIVSASIILQLLNGSGIINFNLQSHEGRRAFQAWQKLLTIAFIIFESVAFVASGALQPAAGVPAWLLIAQLMIGGYLIVLLDEVVGKYGFGSGISLFIAAGVSKGLMVRLLNPFAGQTAAPAGALPAIFYFIRTGDLSSMLIELVAIISTLLVFMMSVYAMAMKVELPLSFGRVRGMGMRWPLNFIYTSNIPVILVAAVLANLQLLFQLAERKGAVWATTLIQYVQPHNLLGAIVTGSVNLPLVMQSLTYLLIMTLGSMLFSIFWVYSAGMDAKSLAKQIMASGLQVPGFRRDPRVLERLLERYIMPLAVMGGLAVGFLAGIADLSGALTSGTGLLLAVMIVYQLYQEIAKEHAMDMHPMLKKFIE